MNKEFLKDLIELVPDEDVDLLHKIILKFIPEVPPELDEIEAIEKAKMDREQNGTIPHEMVDWE